MKPERQVITPRDRGRYRSPSLFLGKREMPPSLRIAIYVMVLMLVFLIWTKYHPLKESGLIIDKPRPCMCHHS
jgi:hypothetical protein